MEHAELVDNKGPGTGNPADLGTRGVAAQWQVEMGSVWQDGPPELAFPRDKWPATREFRRQLPKEELLVKPAAVTTGSGSRVLSRTRAEVLVLSGLSRTDQRDKRACRCLPC